MANPDYVISCYIKWTNQSFSMKDLQEGKFQGLYIPEWRWVLEKECGVEDVNLVFGEPTHLEKAEGMFLQMKSLEDDHLLKDQEKYEFLIQISDEIANACGKELDSNNLVWDKYAVLFNEIPIGMFACKNESPLDGSQFKKEEMYVTADQLRTAKIWLSTKEAQKERNLEKKLYFEYIFELVYISLKRIFAIVKKEIMGK